MEEIKEALKKINLRLDSMEIKLFCESSGPSESEEVCDKSVPGVFLSEEKIGEILRGMYQKDNYLISATRLYRYFYPKLSIQDAKRKATAHLKNSKVTREVVSSWEDDSIHDV